MNEFIEFMIVVATIALLIGSALASGSLLVMAVNLIVSDKKTKGHSDD